MFELSVCVLLLLFAVWSYLLYRFHLRLSEVDPTLSKQIGTPSLFWTVFNGHIELVSLISRRDLATGRYAPMAGQARLLRAIALALIACLLWVFWLYAHPSAA